MAELTRLAARYPKRSGCGKCLSPATLFVLNRVFVGIVHTSVAILQPHEGGSAIGVAFTVFCRFQFKGLQSFFAGCTVIQKANLPKFPDA
jgi:hypothetical protein